MPAAAMFRALLLLLALALWSPMAGAAAPATASAEIEHLLDALGGSGCRFERNGRWYDAVRAEAHLRRKLPHYLARARPATAEGFIAHVATRSSFTGRAYRVRCGEAAPVPTATWLQAELARLRAAPAARE